MNHEKTSPRVAAIAGRVLQEASDCNRPWMVIRKSDVKALAASCLNQAGDKPKKRTAKK